MWFVYGYSSGPLSTKKTPSYGYKNSQYKHRTVWRPSLVNNGIPIPIRSCLLSEYRPRFASKASASEMILKDMGKTDRHHTTTKHDDVIKWKYFQRYWPFVRGIHRSPVNSPHKGHLCGAFIFSLICAWINGWVNNRETGNLRRHHAHYDVTVMTQGAPCTNMAYIHYIKCGIKLLIHSQTSTVAPFGNLYVILAHTFLGMWLLMHAGIKVFKRGPRKCKRCPELYGYI